MRDYREPRPSAPPFCAAGSLTVCGWLIVAVANAQSDSASPAFEVASVKQRIRPAGSFIRRPHFNSGVISCGEPTMTELFDCGISGTRFSDSPASLLDLIIDAYNVRADAVVGLPGWGDSGHDVYDVNARVAGDRTLTLDQVRRMLQTLLADRFQLRAHRETRVMPVYELIVTNKSRLVKSAEGCDPDSPETPSLIVPVPERWERLPAMLSRNADRPVIDKTGLEPEARYCLSPKRFPYTAGMLLAIEALHPNNRIDLPENVADAVNEFESIWGLKLISRKEPMDILVVDHVERPSEN
jgi:bla regulator protein blaR1